MNDDAWARLLGLAYRARKVISGEEAVIQAIQQKVASVVLISTDASERTKKTVNNKCESYNIPLLTVASRGKLGQAIGKQERVLVAVTDNGFGRKLIDIMDQ